MDCDIYIYTHTSTHTHTHIYTVYLAVCVKEGSFRFVGDMDVTYTHIYIYNHFIFYILEKKGSSVHQGCIYLTKNTVNIVKL